MASLAAVLKLNAFYNWPVDRTVSVENRLAVFGCEIYVQIYKS